MKGSQTIHAYFAALCAAVLLCSCHSKEWVAQNSVNDPALIVPLRTSSPAPRALPLATSSPTAHSPTRSKRERKIASWNRQNSSSRSDAKMLNANPMLQANYKIAGIGHAQDPSTVTNWNWAKDFGGTVDMLTIGF